MKKSSNREVVCNGLCELCCHAANAKKFIKPIKYEIPRLDELGTFEASKKFNVSVPWLLNLINRGRLDARKNEYNRWRITRKSLEAWKLAKVKRGAV